MNLQCKTMVVRKQTAFLVYFVYVYIYVMGIYYVLLSLVNSVMLKAWRERKPEQRIVFAKQALEEKADYVPALLLMAEEDSSMLVDVSSSYVYIFIYNLNSSQS